MTAQRIAIVLHDFHRGGTERVAIGLAQLWAAQGRAVTIVCGSEEGGLRATVDARVPVQSVGVRRGFLSRWRLGPKLARRLAALKPDIIFLSGNYHLPLAPALRGIAPIAAKISNPPLPIGFGAPVLRYFARAISGFACMNAGLAREMRRLLPGCDVQTLYDPASMVQAPRPDRGSVPEIVWIGRLEPQKDVGLALLAIAELKKTRAVHLTILGDGGLRRHVDRLITAMRLGNTVTICGHVPGIEDYLARADALLITSRYEGGPAVAVEALAQGVPVVSTDCSHLLREIITMPDAGRIIASRDPRDLAMALAEICDAPRLPRADLAALVTRFSPEACARAYLEWFDQLVRHDG